MVGAFHTTAFRMSTLAGMTITSSLAFISPASAAFDPESPDLVAMTSYTMEVPGKMPKEKCFITPRFPETTYLDFKDEDKLCRFNLYNSQSTHEKAQTLYACPKVNNTSIGIEMYKVPAGMSALQFQKTVCSLSKPAKEKLKEQAGYPNKDAKFKLNSPGVSVGSLLGYYHIANFLQSLEVPASVLRTVDLDTALDHSLAGRYLAVQMKNRYLEEYWNNELSVLVQTKHGPLRTLPQTYTVAPHGLNLIPATFYRDSSRLALLQSGLQYWNQRQVTKEQNQVFGVLSVNPSNEGSYIEASGTKTAKYRVDQFRNSSVFYPGLKDPRPIEQVLASRDLRKVGQKMQGMQDTSAMLVIDFLFDQSDRIGNIHFYRHHFYQDSQGAIQDISNKKYQELLAKDPNLLTEKEAQILSAVKANGAALKVMLLKDNDGGFDLNIVKKYHLLANVNKDPSTYATWKDQADLYLQATMVVRHFNPQVYKGVVKLYHWMFNDPEIQSRLQQYFVGSLQFTEAEYRTFRNNLLSLYRALYKGCKSGTLHLDLDTKNYFSALPVKVLPSTPGVCEGSF